MIAGDSITFIVGAVLIRLEMWLIPEQFIVPICVYKILQEL